MLFCVDSLHPTYLAFAALPLIAWATIRVLYLYLLSIYVFNPPLLCHSITLTSVQDIRGKRIQGPPWVYPNGQLGAKFLQGLESSESWARCYGTVYKVWAGLTPEMYVFLITLFSHKYQYEEPTMQESQSKHSEIVPTFTV